MNTRNRILWQALTWLLWLGRESCGPPQFSSADVSLLVSPASSHDFHPLPLGGAAAELDERHRRMLPLLRQASEAMDEVFWLQSWGPEAEALAGSETQQLIALHYGLYNRFRGLPRYLMGCLPTRLGPASIQRSKWLRA